MSYRYKVATVFLMGFFIDCINIFMSAIALPDIASAFQVSQSMITWVANSYILGLILIMPISTWLAGKFGYCVLLVFSMLLFSLAVMFCGLSDSIYSLIFWRFIQGIGGGLLIPVGQALVFALFPGHQRSRISTMIMAIALIAPAFSPTVGGIIVDSLSWQWIFFLNLPFSLLTALLAWCWIQQGEKQAKKRPDIKGLTLFCLSLLSLLLAFSFYGDYGNGTAALISLMISIIAMKFYLQHAKKCSEPILNLSLLKESNLRSSFIIYYAVPGIFTGVNLLNIFNLQDNFHFNAQQTGYFMILYAIGAFISMLLCGALYRRLGKKILFFAGVIIHSLGILLLFFVTSANDLSILICAYLLMGAGGGIAANTAQITSLMDFQGNALLQGSVLWNINRQISFSVGAVVLIFIHSQFNYSMESLLAYQYTFLIAAILGAISLFFVLKRDCKDEK
nr:MFS transporter [uncultured Moellerella sp.]